MTGGDWQVKNCCTPGGWAFEFVNTQYPDVDDSAVVLTTLHRLSSSHTDGLEAAKQRGMDWVLEHAERFRRMGGLRSQQRHGDFESNPLRRSRSHGRLPYCGCHRKGPRSHGVFGFDKSHPRAVTGIQFLRELQEPDGCWWGRWGVNYIYGTWGVLRGLINIGEDPKAPWIQAALQLAQRTSE